MPGPKFDGVTYSQLTNLNVIDCLRINGQIFDGIPLETFAFSSAASQQPSAVDTVEQIEFGTIQIPTDAVTLDVSGTFTWQKSGTFLVLANFIAGTMAAGTSNQYTRAVVNGMQIGGSRYSGLITPVLTVPQNITLVLDVKEGDTLKYEFYNDSQGGGTNVGMLRKLDPTLSGWDDASAAIVAIYRIKEE